MRDLLLKLQDRSEVKLACFGLAAILAVYFGFLGLEVGAAGDLVKRFGYYFMLAAFSLWVFSLWRMWRQRPAQRPLSNREGLAAGTVIGLLVLVALTAESFQSKILYDEFVLQATAYSMHYFREAATMMRGYDVLGVFISTETYLDKRPNFFPFLVSVVHDLTGYRTVNAYWLNAFLLPVALGLVYYLGRQLNGMRGGMLAVLLLGSLPLLGQNATGSGMELLNVVMILAVTALSAVYLRQPDEDRLSALVIGTVLLAQSRYESALFVAPVAVIILLGWWQKRRVTLSWITTLAPLLLLPSALQNKVLSQSRWMWELKDHQDARFGVEYLAGNLEAARKFFFYNNAKLANSWPLAVLGTLSLAYLLWRLLRFVRTRALPDAERTSLLLICLGILTNAGLLMFYYWANLEDPIASRLSLPVYLLLAFAIVAAAADWDRVVPASKFVMGGMVLFAMGVSFPHQAQHLYSYLGTEEIEWEKRYVASRPPGERLIITNKSTIPWLLEKTPSILITRGQLVGDRLKYQLEQHTFREILVFQALRPTTVQGDHELVVEDQLPPGFALEIIMEKRFGTKIDRVSRLVAVDLEPVSARVTALTHE